LAVPEMLILQHKEASASLLEALIFTGAEISTLK